MCILICPEILLWSNGKNSWRTYGCQYRITNGFLFLPIMSTPCFHVNICTVSRSANVWPFWEGGRIITISGEGEDLISLPELVTPSCNICQNWNMLLGGKTVWADMQQDLSWVWVSISAQMGNQRDRPQRTDFNRLLNVWWGASRYNCW